MKVINIEFHICSANMANITQPDAYALMEKLKEYQLFPQLYKDMLPNGNYDNKFIFSNALENLSVKFQFDRIIVTQAFDPLQNAPIPAQDLKDVFLKLQRVLETTLEATDSIKSTQHTFNRVSIVNRMIEMDKFHELYQSLEENSINSLPWVDRPTKELSMRTCSTFDAQNETYNCVITMHDGAVEQTNGAFRQNSPCILTELDINTVPENNSERFTKANLNSCFNAIVEKQLSTFEKIDRYIAEV